MEKLYHYLWKTRIKGQLQDVEGRQIEIIDPGIHNNDAGPDFFNAKIKIDDTEWIGNVEIHEKASDWYRHNHDKDAAYNNVILHVVGVSDRRIKRDDGSLLPQVELTFPEEFFKRFSILSDETDNVRCARYLPSLSSLEQADWLESLSIERLQQKGTKVKETRQQTGGDWEQTCFILFARGLGFGLNGDPFEMVAKSLPLRILHHHSDNLMQLEALIFGQAGMLDPTNHLFDEYYQLLCREYYFLAKKYSLRPLRQGLWKYLRTRPQNFPHRRLAMLAASAYEGFSLFTRLIEAGKNSRRLPDIFDMKIKGYWSNHFSFDTEARDVPSELSESSRILLSINVAIPLLYAYASSSGDIDLGEKTAGILMDLPAENNAILRQWKNFGLEARDASRSQALIHLRKEYCDKGKCIYCRFGHQFLRKSI